LSIGWAARHLGIEVVAVPRRADVSGSQVPDPPIQSLTHRDHTVLTGDAELHPQPLLRQVGPVESSIGPRDSRQLRGLVLVEVVGERRASRRAPTQPGRAVAVRGVDE
jgi:hypothetical protein